WAASRAATWSSRTDTPSAPASGPPIDSVSRSSNAERSSSVSGPVGPGRGCGPGVVTAYTLADAESHIRQPGPQALIADRDRLRPVAPGESDDRTREFETTQSVGRGLQMEGAVHDRALELHRGLDATGV